MTRANLLLLVALIVSSVYLVRVAYESRRLFAALDRAQGEERSLANEGERLKTELRSQATPLRVERVARDRLAMRTATPAVTQYVTYGRAASAPWSPPRRREARRDPAGDAKARAAPGVRSVNYSTSPLLAAPTPPWRSKLLVALVGLGFMRPARPGRLRAAGRTRRSS